MNNDIHRKTMENLINGIKIKLVNNKKVYLKCTSKESYMLHKIFDYNLVAICKSHLALKLNKPAFIGMCILELSKALVYKFHFHNFKNKYGNNSRLLLTDADTLMYEIKTEDAYDNFSRDKEIIDFSNYSTKSKYYDSNKLVMGKMKDQTADTATKEFVRLKPKMH